MTPEPIQESTPATPTDDGSGVAAAAPCSAFVVHVEVSGETMGDAWDKLLSVVCLACESKNRNDHKWPLMVWNENGKISVKPNADGDGRREPAPPHQ